MLSLMYGYFFFLAVISLCVLFTILICCSVKEAFYVGPPVKDKLPKVCPTTFLFCCLKQGFDVWTVILCVLVIVWFIPSTCRIPLKDLYCLAEFHMESLCIKIVKREKILHRIKYLILCHQLRFSLVSSSLDFPFCNAHVISFHIRFCVWSFLIYWTIFLSQLDENKGKSSTDPKTVSERLEEQVFICRLSNSCKLIV